MDVFFEMGARTVKSRRTERKGREVSGRPSRRLLKYLIPQRHSIYQIGTTLGSLNSTARVRPFAWSMLLRYFDGKHAIEDMSPREGLKRKKVWQLVQGVKEGGWLVVVRHW